MINGKIKSKDKVGKEFGPMDIDYRKRCAIDNDGFVRLYYGHTAQEFMGPGVSCVYDVTDNFKDLSVGGRKPGKRTVELIDGRQKFFFTKHLGRDDLQGGGDVDSIRARYAPRSIGGATETQTTARGTGSGDRYFYHAESDSLFTTSGEEPKTDGLVEEISETEYNEIKRKQEEVKS